jgi:ribosomal protein L2
MWKQCHDFPDMLEKYQTLILVGETNNDKTTQRGGEVSVFTYLTDHRKGLTWFRILDYDNCNGYIREIVTNVLHDHDRRANPCKVSFRNAFYHIHQKELFVVVEGFYSDRFIYWKE